MNLCLGVGVELGHPTPLTGVLGQLGQVQSIDLLPVGQLRGREAQVELDPELLETEQFGGGWGLLAAC